MGRGACEELGVRTVGDDGALSVDVPADSVATVYPHRAGNLPPGVTEWGARPAFLKVPASSVELHAAATDPEGDALTYAWSVESQPAGGGARIAEASGAKAYVEGMSMPGEYVFAVRTSDGSHEVTHRVVTMVFDGNQPPVLADVHNRIPVRVTVKDAGTLLRGGAWDVENDPVTFHWSVVQAPEGASVKLETPDKEACRAAGMTVPGDYVFRLEARDASHAVHADLTVPVYE